MVCLLHNTTQAIDFSSSHKVGWYYYKAKEKTMLFETQFSLSLLSQLIEQWKQIAANLVILVATNLVSVLPSCF